jgi:hypothetical protein
MQAVPATLLAARERRDGPPAEPEPGQPVGAAVEPVQEATIIADIPAPATAVAESSHALADRPPDEVAADQLTLF